MSTIQVNHVTKEYRLGHLTRFKDNLKWGVAKLLGKKALERKPFKALDDIDFNVEKGEVVGIIGPNGAGKSTLLKILSNVVQPTYGSIQVEGKVAPLIEVGAGLVGDLTGRENIYLNSSILGIPRSEIKKKMDDIISFAELEEFIDTPIKRYSSGMKVRLGFSIATSIDAEILIVDEVLAVGDLAFQRKCFDRMEDMIKGRGNTVLIVSHNIRQIERMCSRVLLLDQGKLIKDSSPKDVCNAFYERSDKHIQENIAKTSTLVGRSKSSGDIELESVTLINSSGNPTDTVKYLSDIVFRVTFRVNKHIPEPIFGLGIHTTDFLYLATSQSLESLTPGPLSPGTYVLNYKIRKFPFLPGVYSLRFGVALSGSFQSIFYGENIIPIQVVDKQMSRAAISFSNDGFIAFEGDWELLTHESLNKE